MHSRYLFRNILGVFIYNEHFREIGRLMFNNDENDSNAEAFEKRAKERYRNIIEPQGKELTKILEQFTNKQSYAEFRNRNITITKLAIKTAITDDLHIIRAVHAISEIDKAANILIKSLREWYAYGMPELEAATADHQHLLEKMAGFPEAELLKGLAITKERSMGQKLGEEEKKHILSFAKKIQAIYAERRELEIYIEKKMQAACPNISAVAGAAIGAKLLAIAGSLKQLMEFPASTVQLLGAEEALFRHLKKGSRCPKYGILHEHPFISQSKKEMHGKVARALADKISLASRIDYFRGKFIGDSLKEGIRKRFSLRE
ncbi:TPA: NOP58 family protein [Candidatus Woesearchaeota archaeon]|nr:NOP58 family protein [Candidatus Woesearchaeota archaeon]HII69314.1 NOP58 family protein [Candidatus Woesearchaeota archaeon]